MPTHKSPVGKAGRVYRCPIGTGKLASRLLPSEKRENVNMCACLPSRYGLAKNGPHRGMSLDTVARRMTTDTDSEKCDSLLVVRSPISLAVRSPIYFGC